MQSLLNRLSLKQILSSGILLIIACSCSQLPKATQQATCSFLPAEKNMSIPELFSDNLDRDSLSKATERSIAYMNTEDLDREISVCGRKYRLRQQLESLLLFKNIIQSTTNNDLTQKVYDNFDLCLAQNSNKNEQVLVTGYFQPRLRGSLHRQPPFIYPLYAPPSNLVSGLQYGNEPKPKSIIGKISDNRLVPYWRRSEIENKGPLRGKEILYLDDPIDAFTLHVQGSGIVELTNGNILQVHYAGSNGWPYKSIGKLLADEGKIPLQEVTMPKIRQYLNEHLDDQRRILHYNDRYIFFTVTEGNAGEPTGAMGEKLIPGRSIALDNSCFDQGGLFFLKSQNPEIPTATDSDLQLTSRFVLHHDTGAAIRGSGRVDLYMGSGAAAGFAAGNLKAPALLYVLIKKN